MTSAEANDLRAQTWVRESDEAEYTGYTLAILLRHWRVKPEELLATSVGQAITDPMKQCPPYRRIR